MDNVCPSVALAAAWYTSTQCAGDGVDAILTEYEMRPCSKLRDARTAQSLRASRTANFISVRCHLDTHRPATGYGYRESVQGA